MSDALHVVLGDTAMLASAGHGNVLAGAVTLSGVW